MLTCIRGEEAAMLMHRSGLIVSALTIEFAICCAPREAGAGFTFLGPTPYLSKADSPFPLTGVDSNFYLEDFEPDPGCVPGEFSFCGGGKFDAFGVQMVYGNTGHAYSVDADDGVIDGSGLDGASAIAEDVFFTPSSSFVAIEFDFDAGQLGFLPTAVGMVLTDVPDREADS